MLQAGALFSFCDKVALPSNKASNNKRSFLMEAALND